MARYKHIDTSPRFIAADLERQLQPGAFEHALNYLIDHELDLRRFDARYKNDLTGASAYGWRKSRWMERPNVKSATYKMVNNPSRAPLSTSCFRKSHFSSAF